MAKTTSVRLTVEQIQLVADFELLTCGLILRWLSEGRTFAELHEAYPHIGDDDMRAALAYAADMMRTGRPEAAE